MISLIPIFLIAPGLLAQKAIYNSLYQACKIKGSSQNGCGPNLICNYHSDYYSQCKATPTLEGSLYRPCMKGYPGCPVASYCKKDNDYWSQCVPCKSEFTSCESTENNPLSCCPGTTCTSVSAYVEGKVKPVRVCLSPSSLQKRKVGFCYSGCPASICPYGQSICVKAGSGALVGKAPTTK